ncbi:uncharacterized protein T19C3.4-like [Anneissia japonica]|uniref:uncharacterized protein T19C3.4-like n=1 Tax=Anneissia japonica TaxID=1529436 RepID=UPI0014256BC8|nr:uncharacterized protein T19C3.4-like [Anneissia japonica]
MVSYIVSRLVVLVFGTLYPAYSSYKAIKSRNVKEYVKWMMYWIVFAIFSCVETFSDIFAAIIPFYYEAKILFIFWLISPWTKGATYMYRKFIHPTLSKKEKDIDDYIAHASDKGYEAFRKVSQNGLQIAANVVMKSAVKGQATLIDQIRRYQSDEHKKEVIIDRTIQEETEEEIDEGVVKDSGEPLDNKIAEERFHQQELETQDEDCQQFGSDSDIDFEPDFPPDFAPEPPQPLPRYSTRYGSSKTLNVSTENLPVVGLPPSGNPHVRQSPYQSPYETRQTAQLPNMHFVTQRTDVAYYPTYVNDPRYNQFGSEEENDSESVDEVRYRLSHNRSRPRSSSMYSSMENISRRHVGQSPKLKQRSYHASTEALSKRPSGSTSSRNSESRGSFRRTGSLKYNTRSSTLQ